MAWEIKKSKIWSDKAELLCLKVHKLSEETLQSQEVQFGQLLLNENKAQKIKQVMVKSSWAKTLAKLSLLKITENNQAPLVWTLEKAQHLLKNLEFLSCIQILLMKERIKDSSLQAVD